MQLTSIIGLVLGILAVFGGAIMEGIHITAILQPTAFIIVAGGTTGATLLHNSQEALVRALKEIPVLFMGTKENPAEIRTMIVSLALKARKEGILALQGEMANIEDPFLKKGLMLMTDGTDPHLLRELMETELRVYEEDVKEVAKVFEGFGGYAPTVGIIGAVLGLIHVMSNLNDPSKLGSGIAVAFVATVYGVGMANLMFIPMGGKVKAIRKTTLLTREMMIEGVLAIQAGESPSFIEEKLKVFDPASAEAPAKEG